MKSDGCHSVRLQYMLGTMSDPGVQVQVLTNSVHGMYLKACYCIVKPGPQDSNLIVVGCCSILSLAKEPMQGVCSPFAYQIGHWRQRLHNTMDA